MTSDSEAELEFGLLVPFYPFKDIYERAELASKLDIDSIWMADHTYGIITKEALDPLAVLAILGHDLDNMKFGTAVTDVHRRHPSVLAQTVTTIDRVSNGGAILGLGAGISMNLDPYGVDWNKPFTRTKEASKLIKELWISESVNFEGEFFKTENASLPLKPVQDPHPPIWFAANSKNFLQLTGEFANGWIPSNLPPKLYEENLNKIQNHSENAGRNTDSVTPSGLLYIALSEDEEHLQKLMKWAKVMILWGGPQNLVELGYDIPQDFEWVSYKEEDFSEMVEKSSEVPDEAVHSTMAIGNKDHCISKIKELIDAGMRYPILNILNPKGEVKDVIEELGDEIIPYLKENYR